MTQYTWKLPFHATNRTKQKLVSSFLGLKLCGDKKNYMTKSATWNFYVPLSKTDTYRKKSVKYNSIYYWNNFKKDFPNFNAEQINHFKLKKLVKDHIQKNICI